MSSSERGWCARLSGRLPPPTIALAAALMLAACTIQPLYGPAPSGKAVPDTLAALDIVPVTTRVAQEVRNQLVADLGAGAATPVYKLSLAVASSDGALGVAAVEAAPVYTVTVSATFEVRSVATGDLVLRGTSRGTASYDQVSQLYANARARIDAENRAAVLAADDIRIRLSAAAAQVAL